MIDWLVKRFIKDYEKIEDAAVRTRYGLLTSVVGICCNLLLFAVKLLTGIALKSISVMADAFNNLSDAASSVIGFVGVKMAGKPADADHPFGHGRMEYISAFTVAFIVIQVGFSLFKTSVEKIFHPEELSFSVISVVILALSVLIKLWMGFYNRKLGKRIHSSVMLATSADSFGDVIASTATILSILVYGVFSVNIDGIVGLVVSVLVMIAGINIAKDTIAPLLGEAIDPNVYDEITRFVESYEGIVGSHDLIVHNYGPNRSMASIHAEVPNDVSIEISHEIIDKIERDAMEKMGIFLVIHMDPVETKDAFVTELRGVAVAILNEIDPRLSLHDFRMVQGKKRINLIFDLVVPRGYSKKEQEDVVSQIFEKMKAYDERCCCVITTEHSFCVEES